MELYKIAGMVFSVDACCEYNKEACSPYLVTDNGAEAEFIIEITPKDIDEEKKLYSYPCDTPLACFSRIYRKLCREAVKRGGFFLHSAAIEYGGRAYAFLAPSGTGKSTHIKLWRQLLGERVNIINGDKPLIMPDKDGKFHACGTPWTGKEGWGRNTSAPVEAICILKRGEENKISPLSPLQTLQYILRQTLIMQEGELTETLLCNIDNFLKSGARAYLLHCNMDIEAAVTAFSAMTDGKE